jgi:hypothetical protein
MSAAVAMAALLAAVSAMEPPAPTVTPTDVEVRLGGIDVACTGIGLDTRAEPRWRSYGVRIELSDARNEYLAGGVVTVLDAHGRPLLSAKCDAPWLLLRLPPGAYGVEATMEGAAAPRSARIVAPRSGQVRVVLRFPEL